MGEHHMDNNPAARNWITNSFSNVKHKIFPSSHKKHDAATPKPPTPAKGGNNNYHNYHSSAPASIKKPTHAVSPVPGHHHHTYGYPPIKSTGRSADSSSSSPLHLSAQDISSYMQNASDMACKYARKMVHLCDMANSNESHTHTHTYT